MISPIISAVHRNNTILWCRHLPISMYGNGFEHFTCYMAKHLLIIFYDKYPTQIDILPSWMIVWYIQNSQIIYKILQIYFQSLIDNGLKISPKKCQFLPNRTCIHGLKISHLIMADHL